MNEEKLSDMIDDMFFIQDSINEKGNFARRIFRKYKIDFSMECQDEYLHYIYEYQHEADNCAYENTLEYLKKYKKLNIFEKCYKRILIK